MVQNSENYVQSDIANHRSFVKIIHKKKHLLKVAFWKRGTAVLTSCLSGSLEIDIESKWVYSHIKLQREGRSELFERRSLMDRNSSFCEYKFCNTL